MVNKVEYIKKLIETLRVAAKEKTVELPMQQPAQMTTRHVVSKDMVPTFVVPLKPETRVPEKSITR